MHRPLTFIPFLPLFLSFIFIQSNGEYETSAYCTPSICGKVEVKYPFWLRNDTTSFQHCGYEGFGLNCSPSSTSPTGEQLTLPLHGDDFYVKHINYAAHRVALVDIDAVTNNCPRPRHNLTLEDFPLEYSTLDLNLTFYFNCTSPLPSYINPIPLGCLGSSGRTSYVSSWETIKSEGTNGFDWFKDCEQKVVAPVLKEEIFNRGREKINLVNPADWANSPAGWANTVVTVVHRMEEGFKLDWSTESSEIDCGRCELSEGRCGFNSTAQKFLCFCSDGRITNDICKFENLLPPSTLSHGGTMTLRRRIGIGVGAAVSGSLVMFFIYFLYRFQSFASIMRMETKENENLEVVIRQYGSVAPKRYSYSDIKKMTNSFKDELGQGGYGTVYKGKLSDGRLVAVKILNVAKENGEEFINEVLSISKTSHVNVVMFLGFCLEGKQRALVYEYMPNGSLEKYIHAQKNSKSYNQLGMDKLYQISLGVARGLEYLHQRCNTRILHFDIKPHNILLDEDFCPKISDFGLAKQCIKKESTVSILGARGTIGYIAPELVCRSFGVVSYKSDVYSYGMMILEIVGKRKNVNAAISHTSEIYFPDWAYQHLVVDKDLKLKEVVSPEEDEIARKIILVGLWCIQSDPSQRPTMSKVIEMLEGSSQAIEIPPKAFFGFPSTPPQASSGTTIVVS